MVPWASESKTIVEISRFQWNKSPQKLKRWIEQTVFVWRRNNINSTTANSEGIVTKLKLRALSLLVADRWSRLGCISYRDRGVDVKCQCSSWFSRVAEEWWALQKIHCWAPDSGKCSFSSTESRPGWLIYWKPQLVFAEITVKIWAILIPCSTELTSLVLGSLLICISVERQAEFFLIGIPEIQPAITDLSIKNNVKLDSQAKHFLRKICKLHISQGSGHK